MKRAFIIITVCLLALSAQAKRKKPVWVEKGYHPKYHEKLYFIGIGIAQATGNKAKDIKRADDSARAEIAKQIRVHVVEEVKDIMRMEGSREETFTEIEIRSKSQVDMVLEGIRIAERYYDPKEKVYYSLAVLNRELAASTLYSEIEEIGKKMKKMISAVKSKINRGRCWSAISDMALTSTLLAEAKSKEAVLRVIAGSPLLMEYQEPPKIPDIVTIKDTTEEILSALKLEKVSGDNQTGEAGMPLPDPLIVKVTCGGKGEGGVPVRASFISGKGILTERTKTDRRGLARIKVHEVLPADVEEGAIKIGFDIERLRRVDSFRVPEYFLSMVEKPSVIFHYTIPTKRTISFVILIEETNIDAPVDVPVLKPLLEEALTERNFKIVEPPEGSEDLLSISTSPKTIAEALKDIADVVIVGKITSSFSSKIMEGFYFARAKGTLKAIRTRDGKVIITKRAEDKGAGNTVEKAGLKALETVSRKLAEKFSEALDTTF